MKFLKDYFHFSKKDRTGTLALLLLILLTYFVPYLLSGSSKSGLKEAAFFKIADSMEKASLPTPNQIINRIIQIKEAAKEPYFRSIRTFLTHPDG